MISAWNLLTQGRYNKLKSAANHTYEQLVDAVEQAQAAGEVKAGDSSQLSQVALKLVKNWGWLSPYGKRSYQFSGTQVILVK